MYEWSRFVHKRNVPWLPGGREGRSFHILPALSPRMIAGRRAMRPACRSRRFRGWGCRGRGSAPSSAPRRRRSQGNFAKRQALSAIVNDDVSWLVLPHPHSALSRRPVTILPRELQQAVFVTHHPVFTEHSFFLQPEHVVQLSRRGTLPNSSPQAKGRVERVHGTGRRARVVAIVLGDVMLLQISIGIVIVADCGQPQLLDQPVLAAMMRIPSLAHICPNWVTAASPRNRSCTLGRRTYTFFQSVYKARGTP